MRTSFVFGLAALGVAVAPAPGHSQDRVPASCSASETAGSMSGTVFDVETEVPLRDAKVTLTWSGAPPPRRRPEQRTDAVGAFRFCDVPAGSRARVRVEYLDNTELGEAVTIVAGQEAPVTVRVKAAHVAVQGRVVDEATGAPIVDATVRIEGTPIVRTSDAAGRFDFNGLPAGAYNVQAEHIAYRSLTDSMSVDLGTNVTVEVRMATNAIPLDPIVVDVRSLMLERRGFYIRQERGLGTFLTRDRIERVMPLQPSDVLRGVAGIRMERRRGGLGYAPVGRAGCGFRYFVDGARIGPGFEIDDVPVEWIEALEVYHGISTVPAEFAPVMHEQRGTCGLIVIWTKNRA